MNAFPTHCERCGADLSKIGSIMSKFNQDTICMNCKDLERAHPDYAKADAAEVAAVQRGEMNFPGIGLPPELHPAAVSVRTIIGASAYAVINYRGGCMDVRLAAGRSPEQSLRESAAEMREKAAALVRRATLIELAADTLTRDRTVTTEPKGN